MIQSLVFAAALLLFQNENIANKSVYTHESILGIVLLTEEIDSNNIVFCEKVQVIREDLAIPEVITKYNNRIIAETV